MRWTGVHFSHFSRSANVPKEDRGSAGLPSLESHLPSLLPVSIICAWCDSGMELGVSWLRSDPVNHKEVSRIRIKEVSVPETIAKFLLRNLRGKKRSNGNKELWVALRSFSLFISSSAFNSSLVSSPIMAWSLGNCGCCCCWMSGGWP